MTASLTTPLPVLRALNLHAHAFADVANLLRWSAPLSAMASQVRHHRRGATSSGDEAGDAGGEGVREEEQDVETEADHLYSPSDILSHVCAM